MRFGDALLTVQLAAERVHDDLCPKAAEGAPWHQCGWRPSLIATADALDTLVNPGALAPLRDAERALHARSCTKPECGPAEAPTHANTYAAAALSLAAYVDDLLGQERPAPTPVDTSSATENRRGKVRGDHPETSSKAATAIAPKSGTQRMTILQLLLDSPFGLTDPEIGDETGLAMNSVRPRRVELVEGEWAEDSGRTRVVNGHEHTAWQATAKARAHFGVAQPPPVR